MIRGMTSTSIDHIRRLLVLVGLLPIEASRMLEGASDIDPFEQVFDGLRLAKLARRGPCDCARCTQQMVGADHWSGRTTREVLKLVRGWKRTGDMTCLDVWANGAHVLVERGLTSL